MALSEQQKHLLDRLPIWYEVKQGNEPRNPPRFFARGS